jgi:hypothetical protein
MNFKNGSDIYTTLCNKTDYLKVIPDILQSGALNIKKRVVI